MRSLALLGCLVALAAPGHADDSPQDVKARRAVLEAIANKDAGAFGAQVAAKPLRLYHVWFDSAACAKEFGGKVTVDRAKLPRLVGCLARLGLSEQGGAFVHAPGVEIAPLLYRGKLAGLSGVAVEASVPTVRGAALAKHLAAGSLEVAPDAATRSAVDGAKASATVWLEACVDPKGAITAISTKRSSSAVYARTVATAAAQWTFKPFERGGKAVRVCLQRRYAYPPDVE